MSWSLVAGQLGTISQIFSMCIHNGKLYGGTKAPDQSGDGGQLLEWDGVSAWVSVAPMLNTGNSIESMLSFKGDLYATTGIYGSGASISDGGCLLKWNGTNAWIKVAPLNISQFYIFDLTEWNNRLYAGTFDRMHLFSWDVGETVWTIETSSLPYPPPQQFASALHVYNSNMMMTGIINGILFQFNPITFTWDQKAPGVGATPCYGLLSHDFGSGEELYGVGTNGKILKWDGVSAWILETTIGDALWRGISFGGNIYFNARQNTGRLYLYDGVSVTNVASQYGSEQDIASIISFNGKIYGGTGNNGMLLEYQPVNPTIVPNGISSEEIVNAPQVTRTTNIQSALPPAPTDKEGDIRLEFDVHDGYLNWILDDRDVERDAGFESAILITLLTNKRADDSDPLPDNYGDKGGWWGDSVPNVVGDQIGWKGWLLRREQTTKAVIARCKEYLIDGFQWMIDDGIIAGLSAEVTRVDGALNIPSDSILFLKLIFQKPGGQDIYYTFYYNWQAQIFRRTS